VPHPMPGRPAQGAREEGRPSRAAFESLARAHDERVGSPDATRRRRPCTRERECSRNSGRKLSRTACRTDRHNSGARARAMAEFPRRRCAPLARRTTTQRTRDASPPLLAADRRGRAVASEPSLRRAALRGPSTELQYCRGVDDV
jgi:hypothetical protein